MRSYGNINELGVTTAERSRDYHRTEATRGRNEGDKIYEHYHQTKAEEENNNAILNRNASATYHRQADKLYASIKRKERAHKKKKRLIKDAYGGNTTRNKLKRRYKKSGHLSSIPRKKVSTYDVRIFK